MDLIRELYHRLTWAYHAEATAKADEERYVARVEREYDATWRASNASTSTA